MKKYFKNQLIKILVEILKTDNDLIKDLNIHTVLSKDHPNIIYINCGLMPKPKAEIHMRTQAKLFREICGPEYKIIFFPK